MTRPMFAIVGGGLAGAKAAETLRGEGFDGDVVILGDEGELPYERPPLSKGVLAGTAARESAFVHDAAWYDSQGIELRPSARVTAIDLDRRELALADDTSLGFDKVLLATGAAARRLTIPGSDLVGVCYLRQLADADALAEELRGGGRRVVVVGGGWIGLEVTSAARGYGNEVTVIEPASTVLKGPMGEELGGVFADLHRDHGVVLELGRGVSAFSGSAGRVTAVLLDDGREVPADVVVVGVGAVPNTQLAVAAGLDVDNGVVVDSALRASHPDVYAAGDIARWAHPVLGRPVRVEHWENARRSGAAAAQAMLGQPVNYDHLPFFFTDQYDLGMEYTGDIGPAGFDQLVYRGEPASRVFVAFWLRQGQLVAGMNVNVWDAAAAIGRLIRAGAPVDTARLSDPDVALDDLADEAEAR